MIIKSTSIKGEAHAYNEDFYICTYEKGILKAAVGDWAHNIVGGPYVHEEVNNYLKISADAELNGGVIGSVLAKIVIETSQAIGFELINTINKKISDAYIELGVLETDKARTFTGYFAHIAVGPNTATITAVGDVRIACDGIIVGGKNKKVDVKNAILRREYILRTNDIDGSYNYIVPQIINQYNYQNQPGHEYSYPAIDGTITIPEEEVEILTLTSPKHILMWSDGYLPPDEYSINGLEKKLAEVYAIDPYRYIKYPAVGYARDDRTALEIIIDSKEKVIVSS